MVRTCGICFRSDCCSSSTIAIRSTGRTAHRGTRHPRATGDCRRTWRMTWHLTRHMACHMALHVTAIGGGGASCRAILLV